MTIAVRREQSTGPDTPGLMARTVAFVRQLRHRRWDVVPDSVWPCVQALLEPGELSDSLSAFLRETARTLDAMDAVILVRDEDDLVPLATSNEAGISATARSLCRGAFAKDPSEWLPSAHVISEGRPFELGDVEAARASPAFLEACRAVGVRAVLCVPITGSAGVVGSLNLGYQSPRTFGAGERRVAATLATYASVIVEWARGLDRERRAAQKLRELDELKSDFLSTVSHELRTPLTAISGFSSTLSDKWESLDDPTRRTLVKRLHHESDRLEQLISELLDFARVERGAIKIRLEPIDIAVEVRRAVVALRDMLAGHRVEVDVPTRIAALGDSQAFAHVLANLLANAAKFSPPGSAIGISARDAGDTIVVRVRDEGVGIRPEDLSRVFDRFFRGNRGDHAGVPGTGVGLAIAKQFVEAQGGRIWVMSEPGGGSEFTFTLRRANVASLQAD